MDPAGQREVSGELANGQIGRLLCQTGVGGDSFGMKSE